MKHHKHTVFGLLLSSFIIATLFASTLLFAACAGANNDDTPAEQKIELKTPVTLVTETPTSEPEQN